ncbi:MAG: helix-turn-helix domain-containing protein [Candidatus Poribacteria bacterium]|nr:helix-turn-helix domain-containing protein [Candidatus Poribacteria bacterium]
MAKVKHLRILMGMTQEQFAETFHISVGTIRDWEQRRTQPDTASQTLLTLIERAPQLISGLLNELCHDDSHCRVSHC